jgi:DNA-binding transcriptional MerR regulator
VFIGVWVGREEHEGRQKSRDPRGHLSAGRGQASRGDHPGLRTRLLRALAGSHSTGSHRSWRGSGDPGKGVVGAAPHVLGVALSLRSWPRRDTGPLSLPQGSSLWWAHGYRSVEHRALRPAERAHRESPALYDRIGLLVPAHVDGATCFRSYLPSQLPRAILIARLRSLDVPLEDIRRVVEHPDPEKAAESTLMEHRRRLEARATRIAGDLHRLTHYLHEGVTCEMEHTSEAAVLSPEDERRLATNLFNAVWTLLETEQRTRQQDDEMLHMAHASRHHWGLVGDHEHRARGEWQCSRVYSVLGRPEPALHHAGRVLEICEEHGIADFDLAFAYEALARAHAIAGDSEEARHMTELALSACKGISDDEDRQLVLNDLETIPGQARFW